MSNNIENVIQILEKHNQTHIIPLLDKGNNKKLQNEILEIDFDEIDNLYNKAKLKNSVRIEDIAPVESVNSNKLSKNEIDKLEEIGREIIVNNKFAVCTMAGGQGTRLRSLQCKRNIQNQFKW